jgi:UDP-N-acetylmuramoyl-tripeptide--D-alanyl-D-alanine ligase
MISIAELYDLFKQHPSACTDTRKVQPGDIFFALKGPHFDGNLFAEKALQAGAAIAVVDDPAFAHLPGTVLVDDALTALQQLAGYHRNQFKIPFIAITGSNGKTTTKELVHAVLSATYKTATTQGNLNNHIGVPLTLLSIQEDAEMAVIEMGANHQNEIAGYCTYTNPTHGLITNCGKAHLEGFGGIEGVRKGKGELFDHLRINNGIAFVCNDFDYFHEMAYGLKEVHWYGTTSGEIVGEVIESEPFLKVKISTGFDEPLTIDTNLVGSYNIYNVLAAAVAGKKFNIPAAQIKKAIEQYVPTNSRSQLVAHHGNKIILDAYNANPTSMAAAIENFAKLHAENKMLFIGGMMEMGEDSEKEHALVIQLIERFHWKDVILVGGDFAKVPHPYRYFSNSEEAAAWWKANEHEGNYLLVKGSRSMKMEKIVE